MKKEFVSVVLFLITVQSIPKDDPVTCVIPHSNGGDDTINVMKTFSKCNENYIVIFEKGKSYFFGSPVIISNLSNVEIRIDGNITYPTDIVYLQEMCEKYPVWTTIQGRNVRIIGSDDSSWGWIDGHGQQWWNQNISTNRPIIMSVTFQNSSIYNLKIYKPIAWQLVLQNCSDVTVSYAQLEAPNSNETAFPFNTDGIQIRDSTNILVQNSFVNNGDDCVVIFDGSSKVRVRNMHCTNSHGISVGSLGRDPLHFDRVSDVLVEDCKMFNTLYCARIKSWRGGHGKGSNITFRNIECVNGTIPILISQQYIDQNNQSGKHDGNFSVWWDNLTFENIGGTIKHPGGDLSGNWWRTVPATNDSASIVIQCFPRDQQCTNIHFGKIDFQTELPSVTPQVICEGIPPSENIGFKCDEVGPYVPTISQYSSE